MLAMAAVLPFWADLRGIRSVQGAIRGVNASVVGVLIAALFTPLWTSTIRNSSDFLFALVAFTLLAVWKMQPWIVVCGVSVLYLLVR
jgi:chromate transporter